MPIGPQCWTCRRGHVQCDGRFPACSQCKRRGLVCPGYDASHGLEDVRGGGAGQGPITPESSGESDNEHTSMESELEHFTSDQILEPVTTRPASIINEPTTALYRKAQMIFEGLDYFNKMICPDLVCLENHFNPYRLSLQRIDRIPDIYVKVVVSVAGFHRLMSNGPEPTGASALVQKDEDVLSLRIEALQGLNELLGDPEQQTSDATLLCVLALMVASIQGSAYTEWRAHLEGARRIIQLRGGLKKIITVNPYFKPILTFFTLIDVMGSTTTSSRHQDMPVAATMAMKYWDIEPHILQFVATTCMPCPDVLFRVLILINYLRTIAHKPNLKSKRQFGTREAIEKVLSFSPTEYASRMQYFNGWMTNGKEVSFSTPPPATQAGASPPSTPSTDSSSSSDNDLWLGLAAMYRASTLLYLLRTLVIDSGDDYKDLLPRNSNLNVDTLRQETFEILYGAIAPVFADPVTMHQTGKLIMWPLFILGMETDHTNLALRQFVTTGFSALSQALGTLGPMGAIDELGFKWKIDQDNMLGPRATWDDYFQGRDDYIVF